jgi:uncharacterized lipoprotein
MSKPTTAIRADATKFRLSFTIRGLFMKKIIILTGLAMTLGGCASWQQKSYRDSQAVGELKVPSYLSTKAFKADYVIPKLQHQGHVPASIKPPGGLQITHLPAEMVSTHEDKTGYPALLVRSPLLQTFNLTLNILQSSKRWDIVASQFKKQYADIRSHKTQRIYRLQYHTYASQTRIYVVNKSNEKITNANAEAAIKAIKNTLVGTHKRLAVD